MTTEELLKERQKTHGYFDETAHIAQHLKNFYRLRPGWDRLSPVHRECLDNDAIKTARILAGQGAFRGHWEDKAGYATLGVNECKPKSEDTPPPPSGYEYVKPSSKYPLGVRPASSLEGGTC